MSGIYLELLSFLMTYRVTPKAREQANIFRVNDHLCARFRGSTRMSQHLAHIFPYTGIGMNIELDRCHPTSGRIMESVWNAAQTNNLYVVNLSGGARTVCCRDRDFRPARAGR